MAEFDPTRYHDINTDYERAIWADAYIVGRAEGYAEGLAAGRANPVIGNKPGE